MTDRGRFSSPAPGENRQWRLRRPISPDQLIGPEHFDFGSVPQAKLGAGEFMLRTICLGTSPAQRSYATDSPSMHDKVKAGEVMRGRGVGAVTATRSPDFELGELVVASTGWQDFSVHNPASSAPLGLSKVRSPELPAALALGLLGAAGLTAYFGLTDVGRIRAGDTVVVSAAAGGVGSCAVQIAKKLGCRVVGIAGGPQKCAWLKEWLGVDSAIDYKAVDLGEALDQACPRGIDVFFDNVGGDQLERVLERLAIGARVVICGYISTDYAKSAKGPKNYIYLLRRRARMEGFFVFDFLDRFAEAELQLKAWYVEGDLKDNTDCLYGLEQMPNALRSLFLGENMGVRLCQVAPDSKHIA